jgi:hypothetical protein
VWLPKAVTPTAKVTLAVGVTAFGNPPSMLTARVCSGATNAQHDRIARMSESHPADDAHRRILLSERMGKKQKNLMVKK